MSDRSATLWLCILLFAASCASVGQVANVDDPACRGSFSQAIGSILLAQGESREAADRLAVQTLDELGPAGLGGQFSIESASGTQYFFFVEAKDGKCLLRLNERVRGSSRYLNNLTYIETRELPSCSCPK